MTMKTKETTTKITKVQSPESIKEDLCAVIRMGRLANAVAFAKRAHRDAVIHPLQIRRRQIHQSTFLLAGYLYEAMQLIEDLTPKYALSPAFSDLLLFKSIMDRKYRDILTEFNFSPAYHQDIRSDRKLDELDPDKFDLSALSAACYSSEDIAFLHYPVIYKFYTARIAEGMSDRYNREQFILFLKVDVIFCAERFLTAAGDFVRRTTRKLERNTR
jgi:hypothetical protein